jgi:hypothetical protein
MDADVVRALGLKLDASGVKEFQPIKHRSIAAARTLCPWSCYYHTMNGVCGYIPFLWQAVDMRPILPIVR